MRILCTSQSPFLELRLPVNGTCTAYDVALLINPFVRPNGYIEHLCLDFEGRYIPLVHEDEVRLASELVAIYHQSCSAANLPVSAT